MRIVFMGTPVAAVPTLHALRAEHEVVAVYTQPDARRGRGRKLAPSPVKAAAQDLEVRQPQRLGGETDRLLADGLDAVVVAAYGKILPPAVLDAPRLGCVNIHFSLLPRWRGATPVEHAILAGDQRTGVTTMLMEAGLDTGPTLLREPIDIGSHDTTESLTAQLADVGARLITPTLAGLDDGSLPPQPQPVDGVTLAPRLEAEAGRLDFTASAAQATRVVRAVAAFTAFRGKRLKVWRAETADGSGTPGTIVGAGADGVDVATPDGCLRLLDVQPEGKRRMDAAAFVAGYRPQVGEAVGT